MKAYGIADAKSIIRNYGEDCIDIKPEGIFLRDGMLDYDPTQQSHWKYVCDMDGPDDPNPLTAPCLPFPFVAQQLAAFMLDGVGAVIPSIYGDWKGGPDQEMLDAMGMLAREPRQALRDAYSAIEDAQGVVGRYPLELQKQADRLREKDGYRTGKTNKREGVFSEGIAPDENRTRPARAKTSDIQLLPPLEIAESEFQAAFAAWRKAIVKHLLQTAPTQNTGTPAVETALERNQRRYQMCIDRGLSMPDNDYATLPQGINALASIEGISTQAFSKSIKAYIRHIHPR